MSDDSRLADDRRAVNSGKDVHSHGLHRQRARARPHANQVHSAFGWSTAKTGRAYVVMTDDEEATDTDIIGITNPEPADVGRRVRLRPGVAAAARRGP